MRLLVLLLTPALLALSVSFPAQADDLGVARVEIEEDESGRIEVTARVPARFARLFPPPELLGRGTFARDGYVRDGAGGARYVFEQGDGRLAAGDVLILPWPRPAALARVRLADGTTVRRFFRRTGRGIEVPVALLRTEAVGALERMQAWTLAGVRHVVQGWAHLALVLLLGLGAGWRRGGALFGVFLAGQLVAAVCCTLLSTSIPVAMGEIAVVLAVVFTARDVLRPDGSGRSLGPLLAAAGLLHGAGLASILLPGDGFGALLLVLLGVDGAHLAALLLIAPAAGALTRASAVRPVRRVLGYTAGVAAVAILVLFMLGDERAVAWSTSPTPASESGVDELPVSNVGRSAPVSQLLAPKRVDAPIQSFLTVEPFEVRHDVLLRLEDLPMWTGLPPGEVGAVDVAAQAELLRRLGQQVLASTETTVDGRSVQPILDRVDFVTVGPRGTLPRTEHVPEPIAEARVGVVVTVLAQGMPRTATLTWSTLPPGVDEVPAAVTDPEVSRTVTLARGEAVLGWVNELEDDPVPSVAAVRREPPRLPIPWVALPLVLLALGLAVRALRRPSVRGALSGARLFLVVALVVAPLGQTSVALPDSFRGTPTEAETGRVVGALLTNVYRSFTFRDESDIYDRLALSVSGDQLTAIYLEQSRALEMAERGGARARVESVDVVEVHGAEKSDEGGFVADVAWTVGGSVSHFGHRHFRQNRYRARVTVRPQDDTWKITALDVVDQRREL